jgi:hypothetical protein
MHGHQNVRRIGVSKSVNRCSVNVKGSGDVRNGFAFQNKPTCQLFLMRLLRNTHAPMHHSPCTTQATGNAFDGRTLRPIKCWHLGNFFHCLVLPRFDACVTLGRPTIAPRLVLCVQAAAKVPAQLDQCFVQETKRIQDHQDSRDSGTLNGAK